MYPARGAACTQMDLINMVGGDFQTELGIGLLNVESWCQPTQSKTKLEQQPGAPSEQRGPLINQNIEFHCRPY